MENTNIFEQASREKIRFSLTGKGTFNVEDLWDLKLEDLDRLYVIINKQIKESEEESFLKKKTAANKALSLSFEVVKRIMTVKMEEAEAKKVRAEKAQKKAQILEVLERAEMKTLEGKSVEELKAMAEAL